MEATHQEISLFRIARLFRWAHIFYDQKTHKNRNSFSSHQPLRAEYPVRRQSVQEYLPRELHRLSSRQEELFQGHWKPVKLKPV